MNPDPLQRFVDAQSPVMDAVRAELAGGRKRTHWMWFIFPQLRGLGRSPMAHRFGIESRAEAADYLAHPLLGSRLQECVALVLAVPARSAREIFGEPDDLKFRSCLTLFDEIEIEIDGGHGAFRQALDRFFDGRPDEVTRALLRR